MGIWKETAYLHKKGKQIRKLVTESLPELCEYYSIFSATSFQEFVEAYDEIIYSKEYDDSPDECLQFFAQKGDWRNVRIAIKKGAVHQNRGMCGAALGGHKDLVDFFVEKGANDWNGGMESAARGGHKDLVEFFIEKGAREWFWGCITQLEADTRTW